MNIPEQIWTVENNEAIESWPTRCTSLNIVQIFQEMAESQNWLTGKHWNSLLEHFPKAIFVACVKE